MSWSLGFESVCASLLWWVCHLADGISDSVQSDDRRQRKHRNEWRGLQLTPPPSFYLHTCFSITRSLLYFFLLYHSSFLSFLLSFLRPAIFSLSINVYLPSALLFLLFIFLFLPCFPSSFSLRPPILPFCFFISLLLYLWSCSSSVLFF